MRRSLCLRSPARRELICSSGEIELFKELADLGVKTFLWTGGEPVSHPEFVRLIKAASGFGVQVGVLSNGVGITREIADAMIQYGSWVRISQDDVKTDFEKKNDP